MVRREGLQSRRLYFPSSMTRWDDSSCAGVKGVDADGKVSLFQQEGGERGLVCEQVGQNPWVTWLAQGTGSHTTRRYAHTIPAVFLALFLCGPA